MVVDNDDFVVLERLRGDALKRLGQEGAAVVRRHAHAHDRIAHGHLA
jgi:hypothetical protein